MTRKKSKSNRGNVTPVTMYRPPKASAQPTNGIQNGGKSSSSSVKYPPPSQRAPLPFRRQNSDDDESSSDIEEGQWTTAEDRKREEELKRRTLPSTSTSTSAAVGPSASSPSNTVAGQSASSPAAQQSVSPKHSTTAMSPPRHPRHQDDRKGPANGARKVPQAAVGGGNGTSLNAQPSAGAPPKSRCE
jgi:hypothetical protein